MKMILTPATTPDEYVDYIYGWQRSYVEALRDTVRAAAPELDERLKWGHLVFCSAIKHEKGSPVLIIRAEPTRVLFAFFRGQRLRHIEPRLKPGGKYELATLELRQDTPLSRDTVVQLCVEAARLSGGNGGSSNGSLDEPSAARTRFL